MGLQFAWFSLDDYCMTRADNSRIVRCPLDVLHGPGLFVWPNLFSTIYVRICLDLYTCIGYLWTLPRCIMDEHKLSNCVAPQSAWNPPHNMSAIFWRKWCSFELAVVPDASVFQQTSAMKFGSSPGGFIQSIQPRQTCFHWRWYLNKIRFHKISMHLGSQHVSSCLWQMKAWKLRVVLGSSWVVKYRTT